MTLYIDADACPVKDEAVRVAEQTGALLSRLPISVCREERLTPDASVYFPHDENPHH
jgi:uncharacterized protein YaiI (UPF0178 family)